MLSQSTIWKLYRRREDWDCCPLCGNALKWVKVNNSWCPCDMEPVIIERGTGHLTAVKRHEILLNCKIYDGKETFKKPEMALVPHVYTCSEIKHRLKSNAMGG